MNRRNFMRAAAIGAGAAVALPVVALAVSTHKTPKVLVLGDDRLKAIELSHVRFEESVASYSAKVDAYAKSFEAMHDLQRSYNETMSQIAAGAMSAVAATAALS